MWGAHTHAHTREGMFLLFVDVFVPVHHRALSSGHSNCSLIKVSLIGGEKNRARLNVFSTSD